MKKYRIVKTKTAKSHSPYVVQRRIFGCWFTFGDWIYSSAEEAENHIRNRITKSGDFESTKVIKEYNEADILVDRLKGK